MGRVPLEMWHLLSAAVMMTVIPIMVGMAVVKTYRKFVPIEPPKTTGLASISEHKGDSFMKMLLIGWLICGPIFYGIYLLLAG